MLVEYSGQSAQCSSCHMLYSIEEVGAVEPNVCMYCDGLAPERALLKEIGAMLWGPSAGGAGLGPEERAGLEAAYRDTSEAILTMVRLGRAAKKD